jgi:YVTN family beta-propeller protein
MKKLFGCLIVAVLAGVVSNAQSSGYHVLNTYHIPSPGRWDYIAVCPVNDCIYVSHMTQVNILNKHTGDSVGVINNTDGVHGIAFAPAFNKGFTSNGKLNTVTAFDLKTNNVLAQIKTGDNPDAIMYDPFSKKLYVCNGRSKDLTVIDPSNNKVIKTVPLGGKPETAVSDEAGKIFINIEDKNEVVVLNTKTFAIEQRWKVGKGEEPSGLAIDVKTKRLFAGCGNKLLIVLNADDGKVIKELPIGEGCDGTVFDAETKMIFSSNGEGTLTIIRENSADDFSVVENVPTKKGARTLAVDEKTHKVYLPTAELAAPVAGQKRPDMVPGTFHVLVLGK